MIELEIRIRIRELERTARISAEAELEQLVADVKLGRERVIAERDAMRECVEVLRRVCAEDNIEPDSDLLFDGDKALSELDEAQKALAEDNGNDKERT